MVKAIEINIFFLTNSNTKNKILANEIFFSLQNVAFNWKIYFYDYYNCYYDFMQSHLNEWTHIHTLIYYRRSPLNPFYMVNYALIN